MLHVMVAGHEDRQTLAAARCCFAPALECEGANAVRPECGFLGSGRRTLLGLDDLPLRPYAAFGWQIDITVETRNGKSTGSRKTDDKEGSAEFTLDTDGTLATAEWTGVPPTSAMSAGGTCTVKMRGKQDEGFLSLESVSNTCGAYASRAPLPPGQSDCRLQMRRLLTYQ
jgi:hypothetical protein